jgi:hypothetical protein
MATDQVDGGETYLACGLNEEIRGLVQYFGGLLYFLTKHKQNRNRTSGITQPHFEDSLILHCECLTERQALTAQAESCLNYALTTRTGQVA